VRSVRGHHRGPHQGDRCRDDGVDLALWIGPSKFEAHRFCNCARTASLPKVEFGDVKQAVELVAELNGEPLTDLPSVFEGRLRLALMVHGEQDVEVEAGVVHAVHVVAGPDLR